ncbi:MAG TPA: WYL domain-containing protein [Chitinispirillaceae bacterium]|nr:WYL domain-containing protein [Chitinispirillaceae bacterium]
MGIELIKRDRTARLLRIQLLLGQYPEGLDVKTIARLCSIHMRTAYRDLKALETELNVPIWEAGKKRGIIEGYFLPPITFTMTEALTVFCCARLMYNHIRVCNPGMITTFMQLGSIMPEPLRKLIQNTVDHIEKLPRNESQLNNFNKIFNACFSQHTVKFRYQEDTEKESIEVRVDPYIIESNNTKHYNYLIGYSHAQKDIWTYRIGRIIGEVVIDETSTFEIPPDFDADDYSDTEWGTCSNEKNETVKLRFSPRISKDVLKSVHHPSQKIDLQSDGSLIMTIKARNSVEFRNWVLSFGLDVEVLEPEDFRQQILDYIRSLTDIYTNQHQKEIKPSNALLLSNKDTSTPLSNDRRMLDKNQIQIIRNSVLEKGISIRAVALQMGISRNTVAKYVKLPQPVYTVRKLKPKARPVLEKIIPRINELLKPREGKSAVKQLSGSQIHRKLVEEGHRVGVTTVRNYLRKSKAVIRA